MGVLSQVQQGVFQPRGRQRVIATTTLIVVMSVVNGMNLYIADHVANLELKASRNI